MFKQNNCVTYTHLFRNIKLFLIGAPVNTVFTSCVTMCFSLQVQLPDSVFIDTTETSFVEK